MTHSPIRISRVIYLAVLFTCLGYLGLRAAQHSDWYQQRLYDRLVEGDSRQRLAASLDLARLGAQKYLLRGLQSEVPEVRETSRRALETVWFVAAGRRAYEQLVASHEAQQSEDFEAALGILNDLIRQYPDFAEAWNRRASLYWEMGECEKSMADCRQALELNPMHYGAWQGIGVCLLEQGNVAGACQALRVALKILPHDASTRQSLRECEDLLRTFPPPENTVVESYDLI